MLDRYGGVLKMADHYIAKVSKSTVVRQGISFNGIAFTARETDILASMLSGRSVKSIASILSLSPKTVETYIRTILQKMQVFSREDVINKLENSHSYTILKNHYLHILMRLDKRKRLSKPIFSRD
jgi:DNA-binding CsgD family transcriptional regulator